MESKAQEIQLFALAYPLARPFQFVSFSTGFVYDRYFLPCTVKALLSHAQELRTGGLAVAGHFLYLFKGPPYCIIPNTINLASLFLPREITQSPVNMCDLTYLGGILLILTCRGIFFSIS